LVPRRAEVGRRGIAVLARRRSLNVSSWHVGADPGQWVARHRTCVGVS